MRLLDKDVIVEKLFAVAKGLKQRKHIHDSELLFWVAEKINAFEPVDAIPVVKCRDCSYYRVFHPFTYVCTKQGGMQFPSDNDFCSFGKRRDNDV